MFLIKNNVKFDRQYRFSDCKSRYPLPFDFYLTEHNICIEYNGIQHYEPVPYFGGKKYFTKVCKHDKIKSDYCVINNIKLIVIKYNENIEDVLVRTTKSFQCLL